MTIIIWLINVIIWLINVEVTLAEIQWILLVLIEESKVRNTLLSFKVGWEVFKVRLFVCCRWTSGWRMYRCSADHSSSWPVLKKRKTCWNSTKHRYILCGLSFVMILIFTKITFRNDFKIIWHELNKFSLFLLPLQFFLLWFDSSMGSHRVGHDWRDLAAAA